MPRPLRCWNSRWERPSQTYIAACACCVRRSSANRFWRGGGRQDMRQLMNDLRDLGGAAKAPPSVLRDVLDRLELGDQYALLDTLLGPLYVAWNKAGISSAMRAPSAEAFEAEFERLHHREARPS